MMNGLMFFLAICFVSSCFLCIVLKEKEKEYEGSNGIQWKLNVARFMYMSMS